ncbi:MAG: hypothetical protein KBC57_07185 [Neisseriaceae bacterium]|nr:hypothetical protein [Neisseriaceae bacterium]MBP6862123.1 hypothetical protein [Neisseriaceae bacterium]
MTHPRPLNVCLPFFVLTLIVSGTASAQTTAASALWQRFQSNPQQAQQTVAGKSTTITGVVASTTTSMYGTPNVSITDSRNKSVNIICVMPRTQFGQLSSFVTGQPVTMTGTFYSASPSEIYFKSCRRDRA